mmetsp:Transcript_33187/g.86773  ORF Transcript_33187/g.86773 Transcript_33187/m.86773 type:complete len:412 (+) Transcript_33187:289-1524(+)
MGASGSRQRRGSLNTPKSSFLGKPHTKVEVSSSVHRSQLLYATASMQGWRASMEDVHVTAVGFAPGHSLFAVLDGHAGKEVAQFAGDVLPEFLQQQLVELCPRTAVRREYALAIKTAFFELDAEITKRFGKHSRGGATCTGCIMTDTHYHFFNVGDSRTVLATDGKPSFATRDHKPGDMSEFRRIQSAGGFVMRGRVNGMLAVSRALGDNDYKTVGRHPRDQMVSAEPTCSMVKRQTDDDFVVLACDGVWDVMTSKMAVHWIRDRLAAEMNPSSRRRPSVAPPGRRQPRAAEALELTCSGLLRDCLAKGSMDNMSVIVVIPVPPGTGPSPVSSPSHSPPVPLTDHEVAAVVAATTVRSAMDMGAAVARSIVSPDRPRYQRSMTLAGPAAVAMGARLAAARRDPGGGNSTVC